MKLRKFLLVTTNLVTISTITAVSCAAPKPQKRQFTIQNVSAITVTQTSAQFTAKITGLQGTDQLNVKVNDTVHNFIVSSLSKPADNEYKITISGLTKGTTYLLDTIKVNNDTLFNVKRPFTTLNDVSTQNPPIENREQEEPVNPNPPREENEPSNPGTNKPAPKDPTNSTLQPPKTEPKEPSTGNDAQQPPKTEPNPTPVPKDPTTEQGNSDNTQETPREENTPSNPGTNDPSPKEPATEEPETGVKQPDEEKPNNGTDNGSSGADDSRDNTQPGHDPAPNQPVEKPIQGNDDQETDTGTITTEEDTKSQPTDNLESTNRNQPSDQKTTETPGQDPSSSTDGDTSKDNSNSAKEEEPKDELKNSKASASILQIIVEPSGPSWDPSRKYIRIAVRTTKEVYEKIKSKTITHEVYLKSARIYTNDSTAPANIQYWRNIGENEVDFIINAPNPWHKGAYTITSLFVAGEETYDLLQGQTKDFTIN